jgi:hypothetical protein
VTDHPSAPEKPDARRAFWDCIDSAGPLLSTFERSEVDRALSAAISAAEERAREEEREACAMIHERVPQHCDDHHGAIWHDETTRHDETRLDSAGRTQHECHLAMGAILRYRDLIRHRSSGEKA